MNPKRADDQYSERETVARRDAVVKYMLNTPPKPHSEMKVGKRRAKRGNEFGGKEEMTSN